MRQFFGNRYGVTITAAVLRAALLAFGLPLFVPFFWPLSVRIAAVALVALAWGLWRYPRRPAAPPPRRPAAPPPCRPQGRRCDRRRTGGTRCRR